MATKEKDPRSVTLRDVDFSFTEGIYEKKKTSDSPDAKPKYNFNIINLPTSKYYEENRRLILSALRAAGEKQWKQPDAHQTIAEDNPKRVTYKKAEKFKNKEGKIYAGYDRGGEAFSVTGPGGGDRRPTLLDRRKRRLRNQVAEADIASGKFQVFEESEIPSIFYGGTKGDVIVSFYGTDKGSRGIFCTCELARSYERGERIGGGGYFVSDDDIDGLDDLADDLDDLDDDGVDLLG